MNELSELLDHYFALGVAEGKEGRNHDTADGEAQATRDLIDMKIDRLSRMAERERDKWQPIETAPKDSEFLAYGSYLYPGDKAVTEYTMIAEPSFGDAEFPYRTSEGTHRKGFFSHWQPLPSPPEGGEQP